MTVMPVSDFLAPPNNARPQSVVAAWRFKLFGASIILSDCSNIILVGRRGDGRASRWAVSILAMSRPVLAILLTTALALPLGLAVGFALGIYSTEFGKELLAVATSSEEPADVANPQAIERDHFQAKYPGNWTIARNDEHFDIDQYFSIDTAGKSYILFSINRVNTSPQDNVQDSIDYYSKVLQVSETTSFDKWGKYSGVGVHLVGDYVGTPSEVRIFGHTSGKLSFTVTEFFNTATRQLVKSGYELIETTFVLDPSSVDSDNKSGEK